MSNLFCHLIKPENIKVQWPNKRKRSLQIVVNEIHYDLIVLCEQNRTKKKLCLIN